MHERSYKTRMFWTFVVGFCLTVWLWSPWAATRREHTEAIVGASITPRSAPTQSTPSTQWLAPEYLQGGAASTKPEHLGERPIIHEIVLDKQSVCRGEENFVNVRATGPDGSDAHLRISLRGTSSVGSRMPFRLYADGAKTNLQIVVRGRAGTEVTAPLPPLQINDCEVAQAGSIDVIALGASTDEWRFAARVSSGTFEAQSYEWDFGDGARLVSAESEVVHSYRFRPQNKRYSSFLVTLTMRDATGQLLHTTRALGFPNPAFGSLVRHGEVTVSAQRLDEGGEELTRLYHAYHAPVRIERVTLMIRAPDGRSETIVGEFTPLESLGLRELLPGQPADVKLALANMDLPRNRPLLLVFRLSGSTTDGIRASGVFSMQVL
jgi:hypothetical protein